jgi:EVE domain
MYSLPAGEQLMARYWIGVASKEHVLRGIAGGFCQVCHGKQTPLRRMEPGDWIIYYSPVEVFGEKTPCRKFTGIGKIVSGEPYQCQMAPDFIPWRRDVTFFPGHEVAIEPLLDKLSCISNKKRWGFPFRRGLFEISREDFRVIASAMGITDESCS